MFTLKVAKKAKTSREKSIYVIKKLLWLIDVFNTFLAFLNLSKSPCNC